ncbi:unnamed protein product [Paramecium octaurelia]|uniref:Uncharacterized protein n=1 Tax=Paramecium octaurelia TaxID=43137 RepID=A0A8S1XV60_PAROT|nr:unnamed protein product [Paramecium octaurelia]
MDFMSMARSHILVNTLLVKKQVYGNKCLGTIQCIYKVYFIREEDDYLN